MRKFIVHVVVREAGGFRDVPLRELDSYEEAEITRRAYEKRNPGSHFLVEHKVGPEEETNFQKITKSPEALADFLASLPVLSGPWDDAFHRQLCDGCDAAECDGCKAPERDSPLWWLGLIAEREEAIE